MKTTINWRDPLIELPKCEKQNLFALADGVPWFPVEYFGGDFLTDSQQKIIGVIGWAMACDVKTEE